MTQWRRQSGRWWIFWRGPGAYRRTIGTARAGKAPATADVLMQMVALCPDNMIGRRDRALLALEVADLVEVPDGLRVLIRRSKTDQTGEGAVVAIPRGARSRRYRRGWPRRTSAPGRCSAPWRSAGVRGCPGGRYRLAGRVKALVGLDAAAYSGHSLRSGFLTSAAESGASIET